MEKWFAETGMFGGGIGPVSRVAYDGTEGELYAVDDDPHQFENLWDDPQRKGSAKTSSPTSTTRSPRSATILEVVRPA